MRERIDTFQVGPSTASGIQGLILAEEAKVLAEARKTAKDRTVTLKATITVRGADHIAHIYIEYNNEAESPFNLVKEDSFTTETWKAGVYSPVQE